MANILLLGAGFSKNWGAPITSEFFNALIADAEVRGNRRVHDLLWSFRRTNFEDALGELRLAFFQNMGAANRDALFLLQKAIARVFERINNMLKRQGFELHQDRFTQDRTRTVRHFLVRFDAIFTLNQDLLLEIHYFDKNQGMLESNRRWSSAVMPGMQPVGQPSDPTAPWSSRIWTPSGDLNIPQSVQPFFKLHGSSNWKGTDKNADLMILGPGKKGAIGEINLLERYQTIFADALLKSGTRLTVIGYGFRDEHINQVLKKAVMEHGLKLFVVDPRGAGLAYDERPLKENQIGYGPTEFETWFQAGLYSASITPLRHLLGDESVDREVLEDFLTAK